MRPNPAEEEAAWLIVEHAYETIERSMQKVGLSIFGSRSTGLATPLSDIDLSLPLLRSIGPGILKAWRPSRRMCENKIVPILKDAQKYLRACKLFRDVKIVPARVPIIKATHQPSDLTVQIQVTPPRFTPQDTTTALLEELPALRPLYILLRYSLDIRDLTTVLEGGLGSYSLLMMIATALKHSRGAYDSSDLAGQLLYVLGFYSSADLYKHGFSASPPRMFENSEKGQLIGGNSQILQGDPQLKGIQSIVNKRDARQPYLLSLQDPAEFSNDLGKKAYAIKHIQSTFDKARSEIMSALDREQSEIHVEGGRSFLDPLVRANYTSFEERRRQVERSITQSLNGARLGEDFLRRLDEHEAKM